MAPASKQFFMTEVRKCNRCTLPHARNMTCDQARQDQFTKK